MDFSLIAILLMIIVNFAQSSSTTNSCSNYCSPGGACLKTKEGPKCICLPEWTGVRCEIQQTVGLTNRMSSSKVDQIHLRNNLCASIPPNYCNYNGECYVNGAFQFACQCRYPFVGEFCKDVSECHEFCLNYGSCLIDSSGRPFCLCQSGWEGTRCQKPNANIIQPSLPCTMLPNYCKSGGMCISYPTLHCVCPSKFTGPQCETLITTGPVIPPTGNCMPTTCKNGATCHNTGDSYFCHCQGAYTGKNCDIPLSG
ncbi:hypothetical protein I4U23_023327 [Adineta vaga]|nr:hypothetical protein I4U23_023327 [Adineta vaga]